MEVLKLKANLFLKMQRVLAYSLIVLAILIFILGLGFMTNYYALFFDGTYEMYEYYDKLQFLNHALFNTSLILVIYAIFIRVFDVTIYKPGISGMIVVAVGTVYSIMNSLTVLKAIPYYLGQYNAFDFSDMEGYTPSTFAFDLGTASFIIWIVLAVLLLVVSVINFSSTIKKNA